MPPTDTDPGKSNPGCASAQLTLAFKIVSLQLTPFFRLGSLQLETLSNVVSLTLVAAQQADGPLAAGISFEIVRVELDNAARLKSILLKPLGESREMASPLSALRVERIAVADGDEGAPISVTTASADSTVVQLVGTFTIGAMEFTPGFEIDSLRLEPTSRTVRLRVAPSSRSSMDLPPSFEVAEVRLDEGTRINRLRAVPSALEPS